MLRSLPKEKPTKRETYQKQRRAYYFDFFVTVVSQSYRIFLLLKLEEMSYAEMKDIKLAQLDLGKHLNQLSQRLEIQEKVP